MSPWQALGIAILTGLLSGVFMTSVVFAIGYYGIRKGWWKE